MNVSPITTAPVYARFGHAAKPVTFGGAAKNEGESSEEALSQRATAAQRKTLAGLFDGASVPENLAFKINTVGRPELLTPAGAVKVTVDVLKAAAPALGNPARGTVYVLADYPDQATVDQARANIATMNKLIEPKGFKDKLMAKGLWTMAGVNCPMKPVDFVVNPDKPLQGAFRIPVAGVPQRDITKVIDFLELAPPALLNVLGKLGV